MRSEYETTSRRRRTGGRDQETRTRRLPPYNVIILNDEEHTFEYVIELLIKLFAHPLPTAEELTLGDPPPGAGPSSTRRTRRRPSSSASRSSPTAPTPG